LNDSPIEGFFLLMKLILFDL